MCSLPLELVLRLHAGLKTWSDPHIATENVILGSSRKLLSTGCQPADCYGHGTCTGSTCQCQEGWNPALNCSVPQDCSGLAGASRLHAYHALVRVFRILIAIAALAMERPMHIVGQGSGLLTRTGSLAGCSGHGICLVGGTCLCDPGWEGPICSSAACKDAPPNPR